jgi:hypothetical protein
MQQNKEKIPVLRFKAHFLLVQTLIGTRSLATPEKQVGLPAVSSHMIGWVRPHDAVLSLEAGIRARR